jgi:hypothetical protein
MSQSIGLLAVNSDAKSAQRCHSGRRNRMANLASHPDPEDHKDVTVFHSADDEKMSRNVERYNWSRPVSY